MSLPAIIDCDPGHDDAMAILLGARTLDLRAITTVHGNVSLEQTTRNARQLLELAGLESIPIAAGAARPLVREAVHAPEVHGQSGLDGPTLPPPTLPLDPRHAVELIREEVRATEGLHLLPIGPLTNVALALHREPALADRVATITLMGGSLTFGNSTPAAEFNIWADPDAAHVVFESGAHVRMVGLNVTRQVPATPAHRRTIRNMGSRTAIAVAEMLDFYSERLEKLFNQAGGTMHDPLAVAALIDPEILTFEAMHVVVELRGEHTYGMTLCDHRHMGPDVPEDVTLHRGKAPNVEVAVGVNVERFWELFMDVLATYP